MSTMTMTMPRKARASSPTGRLGRLLRTPKGALAVIFVPLLALAGTAVGWQATLPHVAAAMIGACLVDLLIARIEADAWRWPSSALLSGLIVAFVLGPETPRAVTLAVGALATASKHVFRTRRGHVFNPAALALLVSVPLFGTSQSWWGALPDLPWPWLLLLLAGGAFIVDRLNKFPLVLSFLAAYFGLFTVAALANPARVAEMFRAPFVQAALFLALFMLTDPPTSPGRYADQLSNGALVATASCLAQLLGAGQSYLLIGLLVGNGAGAAGSTFAEAPGTAGDSPVTGLRGTGTLRLALPGIGRSALTVIGSLGLLLTACAGPTATETSPTAPAAAVPATAAAPAVPPAPTAAPSPTIASPAPTEAASAKPTAAGDLRLTLLPEGSQASYHAHEQLVGRSLPNEAVGTTPAVSGNIILASDGAVVADQSAITVDLRSLHSDENRRDNFIQRNTLQTAQFPTAVFVPRAVEGLPLPLPTEGEASFRLSGDLTVHGVTRPVTWQATAQFNGQDVTGSATTNVQLSDFEMTQPKAGPVVSVEDGLGLQLDFHAVRASSDPAR
jgi:polyisoprenoid-binding protein YceI/Na+-translocating ferredoxin:NAD+ oxidoreductase RnfD subunit